MGAAWVCQCQKGTHSPGHGIAETHRNDGPTLNVGTGKLCGFQRDWRDWFQRQRRFFRPDRAWHPSANRIRGKQKPAARTFGPPVNMLFVHSAKLFAQPGDLSGVMVIFLHQTNHYQYHKDVVWLS